MCALMSVLYISFAGCKSLAISRFFIINLCFSPMCCVILLSVGFGRSAACLRRVLSYGTRFFIGTVCSIMHTSTCCYDYARTRNFTIVRFIERCACSDEQRRLMLVLEVWPGTGIDWREMIEFNIEMGGTFLGI